VDRLKITKCLVQDDGTIDIQSQSFSSTINPEKYSHKYRIRYSGGKPTDPAPIGLPSKTPRYSGTDPETLSFDLILDGTGVVPETSGKTVSGQMNDLKEIAYTYNGKIHEPNVVLITWGSGLTSFFGRLTSLNTEYTLFRATGEALRAKVSLSFTGYDTPIEGALEANKSSPDMTHIVIVRAGDTLPLLCQRIYRDPSRYLKVARDNGLDGFRELVPGMELTFKPIR
jgi:hypothetical protein